MTSDWRTDCEDSNYVSSPDHGATMRWLEKLVAAAPELAMHEFGRTPEGRPIHLVVAASGGEFTPELAAQSGKAIVLLEAGIHSGEIEGKDAGLALLRDMTVLGKHRELLEHVILLFIPIFNVDGHERASPFLRINQNGPEKRGTRGTGQHVNLNRDFVKCDAPEMRAWHAMFNAWQPHLFIDIHATNGADYQYDLTWFLEEWENQHAEVRAWQQRALVERVFPAIEAHGHLLAPYMELVDHRDITKGLKNFGSGPRFSTGYVAIRNRPALLVETHMLKDYRTRVLGTYDLVLEVLREVNARPAELIDAVARAEADTIALAGNPGSRVALVMEATETPEPFVLKGVAFKQVPSDISGDIWTQYDPGEPRSFNVPFHRQLETKVVASRPAAYAIPVAFAERVANKLDAHGIRYRRLEAPLGARAADGTTAPDLGGRVARRVRVTRHVLSNPRWATKSFEGRVRLDHFDIATGEVDVDFLAGSIVVPLDQPAANVVVHLLEPMAPDSLLRWGEFDIIFETREYADERVAERLAREMIAADPSLRAEFDAKLAGDPAFAANPEARLDWFFDRSPWVDPELGIYPVYRVERDAYAGLA